MENQKHGNNNNNGGHKPGHPDPQPDHGKDRTNDDFSKGRDRKPGNSHCLSADE